jgi:hypothetical protein
MEDYVSKLSQPDESEKFRIELRKTIKNSLKPYKISFERFEELKSGYAEVIQQYIGEHMSEYTVNQLGFMAMEQL